MVKKESCFECSNCGFCCTDTATQVNLTLLDIKWLSDYMKTSVKELFNKEIVAFVPFMRTDDYSVFDIELGMKRPCPLHENDSCKAYDARPMNCRTFPYWLINHKIEDSLECIKDVEPDIITSLRYREYERMVGKILLTQGEKTDEFMKKIGAAQKLNLENDKEIIRLKKLFKKATNIKTMKRLTNKMMAIAERNIDKKLYEKIPLIEKEIKKTDFSKEIDELIAAEALISGEITNIDFRNDSDKN